MFAKTFIETCVELAKPENSGKTVAILECRPIGDFRDWEFCETLFDDCSGLILRDPLACSAADDPFDDLDYATYNPFSNECTNDKIVLKSIMMDDYISRCIHFVDEFKRTARTMYRSMGIACTGESGYGELVNTDPEFEVKFGKRGEISEGYNPLTNAINKEIPLELSRQYDGLCKAMTWLGVLRQAVELKKTYCFRIVFAKSKSDKGTENEQDV